MKNKIAFISEHASPLAVLGGIDAGGQNVYVAEICKVLLRKGYQIDIFTRLDRPNQPSVVNWMPGIRVIYVKAGPAAQVPKELLLGYMDEFTGCMLDFITESGIQYDLIHANFFMSGLVASRIKEQLGIPYVITFHALGKIRMIHQKEKDAFPVARLEIEQMIVDDADYIIAECPQDQQDLVDHYQADLSKIKIIPCGFSADEFYPQTKSKARSKLGLPQSDLVLLQLGRIVPRKGIDNVIRCLKYLKDIPNVRLLVVGGSCETPDFENDSEFKRLLAIAKNEGVDDRVEFAGRRDRDQLKFYYQAADFFITTPWYEPFGITPLEAMACGTPVIGANVGGIKYTVAHKQTGFLVPPDDPRALADAVREGISCPDQYRLLCKNALKRVNEYFTWESVADDMSRLYAQVAQRPHTMPRYLLKLKRSNRKLTSRQSINAAAYVLR
ncbi:glycosyltransferase family 1 protein [Dyadobacter sp. CY356]|uniref:glycosyltransferase family 4 protein n=1 Tax=Dyadobacter sp. CY356 TaxID=2906442 RepID=UPI001F26BC47|nr:glycosyltransferase family 1 protein [Dyadobacter sp. CY356]MCF0055042.1 glycosyltransferase family 1 protein [Dyadobacter sp. CY356]